MPGQKGLTCIKETPAGRLNLDSGPCPSTIYHEHWGALVLIKDLMRRKVGAVQPDTPLAIAARQMRDDDVGCLPVLDRGRLLGMLTDRDIVIRAVAADVDVGRATVRDAMSAGAVSCFADQSADEAQQLMLEHRVNRLPVLNRRNRWSVWSRSATSPGATRSADRTRCASTRP